MAVARHVAICPPMDTCLSLIEEAMKQEECSQAGPHLPCSPAKGNPGGSNAWQEELDYERAHQKHKLMSSMGLARTDLLPRIQALMEWRRRRRLRRQRPSKLGSSSAPSGVTVSFPLDNPVNRELYNKPEKEAPVSSVSMEKIDQERVAQSERSTRGIRVKPDVVTAFTGRRSMKTGDKVVPPSKGRSKATVKTVPVVHKKRSSTPKAKLSKGAMQEVDKAKVRNKGSQEKKRAREMREGVNHPIPVSTPPSMDQGEQKRKRASPIKLLDSDFVLDSSRLAGEATAVMMKDEKNEDGCLPHSASQAEEVPPRWALRARGTPIKPAVTTGREDRSNKSSCHMATPAGLAAAKSRPKRAKAVLNNPRCTIPDTVGRARLRSQVLKVTKASHTCLHCEVSFKNCDALIMHRLRRVEGKDWPCPLCCKTFLLRRNLRSHVRTHKPTLYKCQNCIVASV